MSIDPREPWFGRKSLGWGWTPRTWQGWLVIGLFLCLSLFGTRLLGEAGHELGALILQLLLVVALLLICALKGEPLRGDRDRR